MSLADAAEARKARLTALRKRRAGEAVDGADEDVEPVIKHRSFDPATRTLKKHTNAHDDDEDVQMEDTVEHQVDGLAEKIIAEDAERRAQELDLFNIAPKRPNWDLKRELDKKVARLERKTQESIHTLIRRRLAAESGKSEDIVGAMKAQERADAGSSSDEED